MSDSHVCVLLLYCLYRDVNRFYTVHVMQVRVFFRSKLAWVKSSKARKHVATDTGSLHPIHTSLLDLCISHTHGSSSPEYYVHHNHSPYIDLPHYTHQYTHYLHTVSLSISVSRLGFGVSHYEGGGGG